jgi:hypothetical protein
MANDRSAQIALAEALRSTVPPARYRKPIAEATPAELAAHLNYLEKKKDGEACAATILAGAKKLFGKVPPKIFTGTLAAATPSQLAGHWEYMSRCVQHHQIPTSIEKGTDYGLWQALESCEKPVYRTKVRCRCLLCGEESIVGFRKLREPINRGCGCKKIPLYRHDAVAAGDVFQHWRVVEVLPVKPREKAYAVCVCDCGKSEPKKVQVQALLNAYSVSCGCHNIQTRQARLEAGHRHGKLVVVSWQRQSIRANGRPGDSIYLCRCDCGEEVEVMSRHLNPGPTSKQKGTVSCKCTRREANSISGMKAVSGGRIANARWLYDGVRGVCLMRSSWELAFAHKLDELGLDWEYEPKTFKLANGLRYTPDFYVSQKKTWYEIKAFSRDPHFLVKADLFRQTEERLLIMWQDGIERLIKLSAHLIFKKYERFNIIDKEERRRIRMLIKQKTAPCQ